jgi:tripartite-type tricarboxylate transporter receptor subunit TctC
MTKTGEDTMPRPFAGLALAAILSIASLGAATAQDYPTRPVRLLQGFAPGGNADAISRVLADELSKGLGQAITVEARPGAGGNLASAEIAKATPDGYTLVLITTGHVISAALYKQLPFDSVNDFTFLTTVSELPFFVVVNAAKSPHKTVQELVAAAKAKPGSVTFGTAGVGTGQHLASELLNSAIGAKMVHVPYRGDSGAVTGLLSGDIDFIMAPLPAIQGNLDAGTFKALATTAPRPWPGQEKVPPIATVVPNYEVMAWTGVATTRGVPKPVVEKLNKELRRVIALPQVEKKLREYGGEPASSTPEEITEKVRSQVARWNKVIDEANIPRQ